MPPAARASDWRSLCNSSGRFPLVRSLGPVRPFLLRDCSTSSLSELPVNSVFIVTHRPPPLSLPNSAAARRSLPPRLKCRRSCCTSRSPSTLARGHRRVRSSGTTSFAAVGSLDSLLRKTQVGAGGRREGGVRDGSLLEVHRGVARVHEVCEHAEDLRVRARRHGRGCGGGRMGGGRAGGSERYGVEGGARWERRRRKGKEGKARPRRQGTPSI